MTTPKVTIMMMVYNASEYLRPSIESALNQSFRDFELLAFDDASTDDSVEIISSYGDPRIRLIRNPVNRGVTWSRKAALEAARAEYIAVLDSDDISYPSRLQEQVDFLDHHPGIDLVGSAFEIIDKEGKVISTNRAPTDTLEIRWILLFGNCIAHSSAMFRKVRALHLGNYDPGFFAGEDFELWVRFATYGKIAQLNSVLTRWRSHGKSLQNVEPLAMKEHFIRTVISSVRKQAGIEIDFDVARCLFRDNTKPTANRKTLLDSYSAIPECLAGFLRLNSPGLTPEDEKRVRRFAIHDIFVLARKNPGTLREAFRAAKRCIDGKSLSAAMSVQVLLWALMPLLPGSVIRTLEECRIRNIGTHD